MNDKLKGTWNPGDTIYHIGDPPDYAYLIVTGTVEFYSSQNVKLGDAGPSEVFGEISSSPVICIVTLHFLKAFLILFSTVSGGPSLFLFGLKFF